MKYKSSRRYDLLLHEDIDLLMSKLKAESARLRNELKSMPGGALYIKKSKSYNFFTEYLNGQEHGIGKDKEKLHRLARRKYISGLIKLMEENYILLKRLSMKMKGLSKNSGLDALLAEYKALDFNMDKVIFSAAEQRWQNRAFTADFYNERLEHVTDSGVVMRSKSERNIGNRLELWNVTYRYEQPLHLGVKTFYPDFTIRKENGDLIYWEHFGMMDDEDYFANNSYRHREYRSFGLCDHTNLIITWESDLHDMSLIDHIIKTRICSL